MAVKDSTTLINPNLAVLCQDAQALVLEGWEFTEGWPMLVGWQYHAMLERAQVIENIVAKSVGRPKQVK